MKSIVIEIDHSEFRILRGTANRQIRTPENLARYLILRGLGLTTDDTESTNAPLPTTTLPTGSTPEHI